MKGMTNKMNLKSNNFKAFTRLFQRQVQHGSLNRS